MGDDIIHIGEDGSMLPSKQDRIKGYEELINRFISETQNLMDSTIESYRKSLWVYFNWIEENGYDLKTVTLSELNKYKKHLENSDSKKREGKLSGYTVSAYIVAVKEFYGWANGVGLMFNPARNLKAPKREAKFQRKPLDEEKINTLFDHFKTKSKRDYAIILTLYYCGLRTIEIVRLNVGDIQIVENTRIAWVQGKGKKTKNKWVKLGDKPYNAIMEYLAEKENGMDADKPIFTSDSFTTKGGRLIPGTISKIVKSGLRAIGIDNGDYTAHSIRHSAASNAIRKGATLTQVQDMLRHENEATTRIYGKMALEEQRLKGKSAEDFL